jgi:hypothetical protein
MRNLSLSFFLSEGIMVLEPLLVTHLLQTPIRSLKNRFSSPLSLSFPLIHYLVITDGPI